MGICRSSSPIRSSRTRPDFRLTLAFSRQPPSPCPLSLLGLFDQTSRWRETHCHGENPKSVAEAIYPSGARDSEAQSGEELPACHRPSPCQEEVIVLNDELSVRVLKSLRFKIIARAGRIVNVAERSVLKRAAEPKVEVDF
jgi:hypothetical protein